METADDLPTLIKRKEHLNVLRYIRVHQLREADLVLTHGKALLGQDLDGGLADEVSRLAALEQICLAALDKHDHQTSDTCLSKLRQAGIPKESTRFRLLLARCLEAADDPKGADLVYEDLLKENPSNLMALKRKYCLLKAQVGKETEAVQALNRYLQQNYADTAAWYELAQMRMELGDYKGGAFCLEEVLLAAPVDAKLHVELAECYATIGTSSGAGGISSALENLALARKHMAQALELDPTSRRAQVGLVSVSNAYLEEAEKAAKREVDEFEIDVAKELVKYGAEEVLKSYKGNKLFPAMQKLMTEYTASL